MWYKAREAHGAQCKKCENEAVYWLESSVDDLRNIVGDTEEGKRWVKKKQEALNGYYCEKHITIGMIKVIDAWDGGRVLLNRVGYRDYSLETKLDDIYFEYYDATECKCDCESKCCCDC